MTPLRITRSEQPGSRLERLCEAMAQALEEHPEYQEDGDRAMIFLSSLTEKRGGGLLAGWENDADAMAWLFEHVKAIYEANGMSLAVVEVDDPSMQ